MPPENYGSRFYHVTVGQGRGSVAANTPANGVNTGTHSTGSGEAPEARPARSLDRPARSLITRQVAAGIATRTGRCVVDPTLVARALGTRARNYDWRQISRLAEGSGAQWIVRGGIKLDSTQQVYDVAVQTYSRTPGEKPRWSAGETSEWGPFAFSDELPPEVAFEPMPDLLG